MLCFSLAAVPAIAAAQAPVPLPRLAARATHPGVGIKIWAGAGSLRLVSWTKDSVVVRGRVPRGLRVGLVGDSDVMKIDATDHASRGNLRPTELVVYLPLGARVSVKTVSASITGASASGWFYSVSGAIRLTGVASSLEVESMSGDIDVDVRAPWVRARTGDGKLSVRGSIDDADLATIGGALDVGAAGLLRGQFASVSGNITFAGAPASGAILDFSNHSGALDLVFPANASASLTLSSLTGTIANGFTQVLPTSAPGHTVRLVLGAGDAQITARSFKGAIRVLRR